MQDFNFDFINAFCVPSQSSLKLLHLVLYYKYIYICILINFNVTPLYEVNLLSFRTSIKYRFSKMIELIIVGNRYTNGTVYRYKVGC